MSTLLIDKSFERDMERWDKHFAADSEREVALMDQFGPCTKEQAAEINEIQSWVLDNFHAISYLFNGMCAKSNGSCDLTSDEIDDVTMRILHGFVRTQVFCPSADEDTQDAYSTLGITLRNADEERAGQIAIYPVAFDKGTCVVAGNYIHELMHVATSTKHGDTTDREDWIYLFGDIVRINWTLDHEDDYCDL